MPDKSRDITTDSVLFDARASVVDLVVRELRRATSNRAAVEADKGSFARGLYEMTRQELLTKLLDQLRGLVPGDVIKAVLGGLSYEDGLMAASRLHEYSLPERQLPETHS